MANSAMGLDLSTAVRMFLKQPVRENGLPFNPNTLKTTSELGSVAYTNPLLTISAVSILAPDN